MLSAHLADWRDYFPEEGRFARAFKFLEGFPASSPQDGRYEVEGTDLYALVQSYVTAPREAKEYETHRHYADIQLLLEGREAIHWAPMTSLRLSQPYSEEKDVAFFFNPEEGAEASLYLVPGFFAVFYPTDGHKPGCQWDGPLAVRKVVVKVRLA